MAWQPAQRIPARLPQAGRGLQESGPPRCPIRRSTRQLPWAPLPRAVAYSAHNRAMRPRPGHALAALALVASLATPAWAQEVDICQTPNGQRTTTQIADEVRAAGYAGPWDTASTAAAYGRATGGPV